jgi:hypothetical protein
VRAAKAGPKAERRYLFFIRTISFEWNVPCRERRTFACRVEYAQNRRLDWHSIASFASFDFASEWVC